MNILNRNAKKYDPRDKITLIETNLLKYDITVPITIQSNHSSRIQQEWVNIVINKII